MTGYIYKITNDINDKIYVGQTIKTVEFRFRQHISEANRDNRPIQSKLIYAIKKYGEEHFHVEVIEECDADLLNEREMFWIQLLDSYHNGYNTTLGGDGNRRDYSAEIMECWNNGMIVDEIINHTGHARETVKNTLRNNGVSVEEQKGRSYESQSRKVKVPVYQYDLDGNYVGEYASIWDAEKETGIHHSCINGVLCGVHYSAGFYQWKRYKADNIGKCPHKFCGTRKTVHQYTEDGDYICSFPSITQAALAVGLKSILPIRRVCNNESHTSKGFRWSYELVEKLPVTVKRINQYA